MGSHKLGSVVRQLRTRSGMSQKELAGRLDVDPTYVSHLEANRREPSIKLLRRIASELEIPAGMLLALVIWEDLPEAERARYEALISRLVDVALVAQLKLPMDGDGDEQPPMA